MVLGAKQRYRKKKYIKNKKNKKKRDRSPNLKYIK